MIDEAKQRNILQDTIDNLKKINEAADAASQEREQRIRDLRIQVDAVRKSIDEKEENDIDDERAGKIRATLKVLFFFREICREKNKQEMPCAGCPLWSICGTLPGNIDDITIEDTAAAVADYLLEKEAGDAENAIPVQPGTE